MFTTLPLSLYILLSLPFPFPISLPLFLPTSPSLSPSPIPSLSLSYSLSLSLPLSHLSFPFPPSLSPSLPPSQGTMPQYSLYRSCPPTTWPSIFARLLRCVQGVWTVQNLTASLSLWYGHCPKSLPPSLPHSHTLPSPIPPLLLLPSFPPLHSPKLLPSVRLHLLKPQ